jgi:hypothetical protein
MVLAHFTLTELPGTLAIWLCGVALGAALLARERRRLVLALALIAGMFTTSMLASGAGWPESVQVGLDLGFAAAAALCLWSLRGLVARDA